MRRYVQNSVIGVLIIYNERVRSKRKQKNLKYQTHEQSYIKDGNIVCGLVQQLEKMVNCEKIKL